MPKPVAAKAEVGGFRVPPLLLLVGGAGVALVLLLRGLAVEPEPPAPPGYPEPNWSGLGVKGLS